MAMSLESSMRYLARKITGKPLVDSSLEETIQFIADNFSSATGEPGPQGPVGAAGVGIKDITGSIDGENNITVKFTLTNGEFKTVTGKITTPQA